jgi:hypothetical protein
MLSRRTFLRALGVTGVAAAGAGLWRAASQHALVPTSGPAFEPWRSWRARLDGSHLRGLLPAAILASSPHNTQPWRFEIGRDTLDVLADPDRALGPFDPFQRELHIGLGAAVENLVLAAGLLGRGVDVQWLPTPGRPERAARLRFSGRWSAPGWATMLGERHVNRSPYDGRPLTDVQRSALLACVSGERPVFRLLDAGSEAGRRFGEETLDATRFITEDREMASVTMRWMRHDWGEIQRRRDGITLGCAGLPPAVRVLATLAPPLPASQMHAGWIRGTEEGLRSSPAYAILSVPDVDDRRGQLEVGRLWQRLHVRATSMGLSAQPLNQWMERFDRERQLGTPSRATLGAARVLGRSDLRPTFAFRIGVAPQSALPSPRRSVEAVSCDVEAL